MAYMSQEHKAKIAAQLKAVMPAGWKYSLGVHHHSTIVLTIQSAPVDLLHAFPKTDYFDPDTATYADVNPYHFRSHFSDEKVANIFERIFRALNLDNYDRSDIQTDYFDVGHYVSVHIGRWDKPFVYTGAQKVAA